VGFEPTEGVETRNKVVSRKDIQKDMRRRRARVIGSRSKVLGPLKEKITKIEKRIIELEKKVEQDNVSLLRASQVGEGKSIAPLSISIHEARNTIEVLFDE
jgi:ATP-binding cassette subfamily F protein 3